MNENSKQYIEEACRRIGPINNIWLAAARARQLSLTKPPDSLGQLEDIGNRIAAISETITPQAMRKRIYVVAGDHGVTSEGVSAYPREVTYQMVLNFLRGGAAINVLARHGQIEVQVVDAGVDYDFPTQDSLLNRKVVRGTSNFAHGPALTREQAERSIAVGIDLAYAAKAENVGLLGIGEMGIGNTTAASAITAVLTGCPPDEVTGRGTGISDAALARKVAVINHAIELNCPDRGDPIDVLAKVGGAEIGVMMGLAIGAAAERLPIVADGFISTAAAALAVAQCSHVRDYLFVAHRSQEPGHATLVKYVGIRPLLDLELRLGEGTGAALAMHLIDAAAKLLSEMATFDEAEVSKKEG
jgi:nicotinate-nucleotide--dimethylbenzimidazole phosphoribosyltransferase